MWESILGLLLAAVAAVFFDRLQLPAGTMVGSLIGILVANLIGLDIPQASSHAITAISIVVGVILAVRFNRDLISMLTSLLIPAMYVSATMIGIGYALGFVLTATTDWEPATAAFSVYPGGLEQMVILAGTLGGNVYIVTVVQLVRWIIVVVCYPFAFRNYSSAPRATSRQGTMGYNIADRSAYRSWRIRDVPLALMGVLGGIGAHTLGLPAGALLGSFAVIAVFRGIFASTTITPPPPVTKVVLGIVGAVMGSTVNTQLLDGSQRVLFYAIALTMVLIVFSICLAYLLRWITGWDLGVCVIAMAPAGTLEMTLLAEQLRLDPTPIFTLHFSRTVAVIVFAPILYALSFGHH